MKKWLFPILTTLGAGSIILSSFTAPSIPTENQPNTDGDEIPVLQNGFYRVLGYFEGTKDTVLRDTFALERNGDNLLLRPSNEFKFKNPLRGIVTDDLISVHSNDEPAYGGGPLFFNCKVTKENTMGYGAIPKKTDKVFRVSLERIAIPLIDLRDGERYATVRIGNQFWMAENLRYGAKLAENLCPDKDSIPYMKGVFVNTEHPSRIYGCLYSWEAVQDACPKGWRVPTRQDWSELINYLSPKIAGTKLKSATGWGGQTTGGKDILGFSAYPAGYYNPETETFKDVGEHTFFWSIDQQNSKNSWYRNIFHEYPGVYEFNDRREYGLSCRCIQE